MAVLFINGTRVGTAVRPDGTSVEYDNDNSSLTSSTVQGAIDEINTKTDAKASLSTVDGKALLVDGSGETESIDFSTFAKKTDIEGISGFDYEIVTELPSAGTKGKIYLIADAQDTNNAYDEYLYLDSAWELIGSTKVDISGKADKATTLSGYGITDAKIDGKTITLGSDSLTITDGATDAASITCTSGTYGGSEETTSVQQALVNLANAIGDTSIPINPTDTTNLNVWIETE